MPLRVGDLAGQPLDEVPAVVGARQRVAHRRLVELLGDALGLRVEDGEREDDVGPDVDAVAALQLGALDALAVDERPVGRAQVLEHVDPVRRLATMRACARLAPASSSRTCASLPRPMTVASPSAPVKTRPVLGPLTTVSTARVRWSAGVTAAAAMAASVVARARLLVVPLDPSARAGCDDRGAGSSRGIIGSFCVLLRVVVHG